MYCFFYIPGLIHPADVFRQVTFTKVNQNLTEQSPPPALTAPPGEQSGSTSRWLCRTPHLPGKWGSTWKEHWWRFSTRAIQSENVVVSWLPMVTIMWSITRTLTYCKEVCCVNIKNGFFKQRLNNSQFNRVKTIYNCSVDRLWFGIEDNKLQLT